MCICWVCKVGKIYCYTVAANPYKHDAVSVCNALSRCIRQSGVWNFKSYDLITTKQIIEEGMCFRMEDQFAAIHENPDM